MTSCSAAALHFYTIADDIAMSYNRRTVQTEDTTAGVVSDLPIIIRIVNIGSPSIDQCESF